nr:MAG TPA: hypothetical protein [Caudoviricetes sp.]
MTAQFLTNCKLSHLSLDIRQIIAYNIDVDETIYFMYLLNALCE